MENLNFPCLRSLRLDSCKISRIENLKPLKKLMHLSLSDNRIEDPSVQGAALQLSDLKALNLSKNRITQVKQFYGYPNVSSTLCALLI